MGNCEGYLVKYRELYIKNYKLREPNQKQNFELKISSLVGVNFAKAKDANPAKESSHLFEDNPCKNPSAQRDEL